MITVLIKKDVDRETPLAIGETTYHRRQYEQKEKDFFKWLRERTGAQVHIYIAKDNDGEENQKENEEDKDQEKGTEEPQSIAGEMPSEDKDGDDLSLQGG